jgi:diguanylate cyclase (GGDEF)-like protein
LKVEGKDRKALDLSESTRAMPSRILLLNKKLDEREMLQPLCRKMGIVRMAMSHAETAILAAHRDLDILVADSSLADYAGLSAILTPKTSILITGPDEKAAGYKIHGWPADYYVDFSPLPADEKDAARFSRALDRAAEHARLKAKLEDLTAQKASPERIREVYSEIKEIKNFINDNVVRELEKRVALQVRYLWFQRRRQKIEEILRKIYMANDVSSLLDTVSDIKSLVQASGISFYILDENETLGKYLKPLVWDDAFLSHLEFSKYIVLLDSPDFAAQAVRHREDVNITDFSLDKRLAKRYVEYLKNPLRSLLGVPIMHGKDVIGVLEVYNKLHKGELSNYGFSREDQQVLRGISEHISMAMTKLNLIQYDALTGLLRPDPFFEKVIQKINQQSKRRRETGSYAMVMGDVDWFKNYNDLHGHEAGNRLLRQLAAVLKASIRDEDYLCRYGGEEFLFFLTGVNSLEEACLLTERIRKNIEEFYFENEESQPRQNLTMSFGVTLLPRKENFYMDINRYELKKVANEADMALAEAKGKHLYSAVGTEAAEAAGSAEIKNKVCVYQPDRDSFDREKKGAVIKPYRQEYFEERRKSRRHYISTLLLYQEDGNFEVTKTVNLSMGGVRIISDTQLLPDKTIDLFLILENKATPFKGGVVYSQKSRQEAVHYHSGIQFQEMGVAQRKALENYLASVPGREASARA